MLLYGAPHGALFFIHARHRKTKQPIRVAFAIRTHITKTAKRIRKPIRSSTLGCNNSQDSILN